MYTFEDKLCEYAQLLVRVGVNVQKGQNLVITSQVDQAPFARLCAQAAYDAGARLGYMHHDLACGIQEPSGCYEDESVQAVEPSSDMSRLPLVD